MWEGVFELINSPWSHGVALKQIKETRLIIAFGLEEGLMNKDKYSTKDEDVIEMLSEPPFGT